MKGILYFLGITLVILMISAFVMTRTLNMSMGATGLLVIIEKERFEQAYAFFTKDFQTRYPYKEFVQGLKESGLVDYQSVKWTSEEVAPNHQQIVVAGVITTKKNKHYLIKMEFVKANFLSTWLVNNLQIKQVENEQSS